MIRVHCDGCGKEILRDEETHFVVKMEITAAPYQEPLTENDLNPDNLEAVSNLIEAQSDTVFDDPTLPQKLRYDLCPHCRDRFLKNPLRPEPASHFEFSQN